MTAEFPTCRSLANFHSSYPYWLIPYDRKWTDDCDLTANRKCTSGSRGVQEALLRHAKWREYWCCRQLIFWKRKLVASWQIHFSLWKETTKDQNKFSNYPCCKISTKDISSKLWFLFQKFGNPLKLMTLAFCIRWPDLGRVLISKRMNFS